VGKKGNGTKEEGERKRERKKAELLIHISGYITVVYSLHNTKHSKNWTPPTSEKADAAAENQQDNLDSNNN